MFFTFSKIFWFLIMPLNALCLLALLGYALRGRFRRAGRALMAFSLTMIVVLGLFPVGPALVSWLEHRYTPPKSLPDNIHGIVVLGGSVESALSLTSGQIALNDTAERLVCFTQLSKKYPQARKIFTGGSGDILHPNAKEADIVRDYFAAVGLREGDVLYERDSRNTYENALYSMDLANPEKGQNWILITSGFHMPRSMAIFKQVGWNVIPYPCDYKTDGSWSFLLQPPNAAWNFAMLSIAVKELLGSVAYYATGKSAFLWPPAPVASDNE